MTRSGAIVLAFVLLIGSVAVHAADPRMIPRPRDRAAPPPSVIMRATPVGAPNAPTPTPTPTPAIPAPSNVTASVTADNVITVRWTNPAGDYEKIGLNIPFLGHSDIMMAGWKNSYVLTNTRPATEYTLKVRGYKGTATSPYAQSAAVTSTPDPPSLRLDEMTSTRICLYLNDGFGNKTAYNYYRVLPEGSLQQIGRTLLPPHADGSYCYFCDTSPATGAVNRYQATSETATAVSKPSGILQVWFGPPAAPAFITATVMGASVKLLFGEAGPTLVDGFRVERRRETEPSFSVIATIPVTDYTSWQNVYYTDAAVVAGETYRYRIVSHNMFGDSPPSIEGIKPIQ